MPESAAEEAAAAWARKYRPTPGVNRRIPSEVAGIVTDPPDPWEVPVTRISPMWIAGRPFRPTSPGQVPESALAALESACGPLPLERFFVVPETTRLINPLQSALSPQSVLAFGDGTVAQWIDDGPGRLLVIPTDRLLAVDDRQILLYGRLRFVAADVRITVRYSTTERFDLVDNIRSLRARIAATQVETQPAFRWLNKRGQYGSRDRLPIKWTIALKSSALDAADAEAAAVAVGDVEETRGRRSGDPSGVAVLGPREFLIASEPAEFLQGGRYGYDLLAAPRDRLLSLAWDGRSLTVNLGSPADGGMGGSTSISLVMDRRLVEAMGSVFGTAVAWI
jgi:hypothetical protein